MSMVRNYESPLMEIVELVIEGALLQTSNTGLGDFDYGGELTNE